jgi:hypothetical protein
MKIESNSIFAKSITPFLSALFLLFSVQANACADIVQFQFTNGTQTILISDGAAYNLDDLPDDFYLEAVVNGNEESVSFHVSSSNNSFTYSVVENYVPYTFPAGNGAWHLGDGHFSVSASAYSHPYAGGTFCDHESINFTLSEGVETCSALAGTLSGGGDICNINETHLTATPNGDAVIPNGYQTVFVLTQGSELVIIGAGAEADFTVAEDGMYTIHSLVYDPSTLDLSIVVPGVTTGFDVFGLLQDGGGDICASLDVAGAQFQVANPSAGTLTANQSEVPLDGGAATISATANGDINVPMGYSSIFVLTQGSELTIVNAGGEPSFEVTESGDYTIHTLVFDPTTLDLSIVELGVTTGVDVFGLIVPGGGAICADLDVAGAPITVSADESCSAHAGTLSGGGDICNINETHLTATPNGDAVIPNGYQTVFVLTQGSELVIIGAGAEADFTVAEDGMYTIHSLVYDPSTLDLSIVVPGVTTGFDVFGLLQDGGGDICASLDVAGAQFQVANPSAGTLTANQSEVPLDGGAATISATANGDINVPMGYSSIFVLTQGSELTIVNAGGEPSFEVTESGDYTIHTLVFDPTTLDLSIVELGVTTGVDVFGLIVPGGGAICADLDVAGASITVVSADVCTAFAGTLTADADEYAWSGSPITVSATPNGDVNVPNGYGSIFVLTQGPDLVIVGAGASPEFEINQPGQFIIHTLVYDPNTLDLGIVELGVTTGFDVFGLIVPGGGSICADLDVAGAAIVVVETDGCAADAGTLVSHPTITCLNEGTGDIFAQEDIEPVIPAGYEVLYVLTNAFGLTIEDVSASPEFTVEHAGFYRVHTLVYDPATLDLSIVEFGVTSGFDVNTLLIQGGGEICASLLLHAPLTLVLPEYFCNTFVWHFLNNKAADAVDLESIVDSYEDYASFEKSLMVMNVSVYPNPVTDVLSIDLQLLDDELIQIQVIDLSGRVVMDRRINNAEGLNQLDLSSLSDGQYVLNIQSQFRAFTKSIQVSK